MPGQFVLEGGQAELADPDEEADNSQQLFENAVVPLKFVHNVFFAIDGTAQVWCELELANEWDEPIEITEIDFGFNNVGGDSGEITNIREAVLATGDVSDEEDTTPLMLEGTGNDESKEWTKMYDEYQSVENDNQTVTEREYANHPDTLESDSHRFHYNLNAREERHDVYTVPVTCKVGNNDDTETSEGCTVYDIKPLANRDRDDQGPPTVLDKEEMNPLGDEQDSGVTRFDTISVWLYWEEPDLTEAKDEISYHFRYAVDCQIEDRQFTHAYTHYILPESSYIMGKAMLMESLSTEPVQEFHPAQEQWMFEVWQDEYEVEVMNDARMTRSKEKNTDHVFNSGRIGFPGLRARNTALQFGLVVLSGVMVQQFITTLGTIDFSAVIGQVTQSPYLSATLLLLLNNPVTVAQLVVFGVFPFASIAVLFSAHGPPPYARGENIIRYERRLEWVADRLGGVRDALLGGSH